MATLLIALWLVQGSLWGADLAALRTPGPKLPGDVPGVQLGQPAFSPDGQLVSATSTPVKHGPRGYLL
jgi:hypothetical protein